MESKRDVSLTLNMTNGGAISIALLVSLRASVTSVVTNRQGILMILALHTVDCFANARNDNWNLVMLSEAKHLFAILIFAYFVKGDRGATCHSKHEVLACYDSLPPIPLKSPKPPHAF